MSNRIKTNSNKLNSKFEGYKLKPFQEISDVVRTPLTAGSIQVHRKSSDQQRLGFRELQARIRQSQLFYGHQLDENRGTAFCIDEDHYVHMIVYHKNNKQTSFHRLVQLLAPLNTSLPGMVDPTDATFLETQVPSIISINHELILAANGSGYFELIGITENDGTFVGAVVGETVYPGVGDEGVTPVPCVLLTGRQVDDKIIFVLYSRAADNASSTKNVEKKTLFNIITMEMTIPTSKTPRLTDGTLQLSTKILHIQRGPEVPVYCAITPSGRHCIFGSEVRYEKLRLTNVDVDTLEERDDGVTTPMEVDDQDRQTESSKAIGQQDKSLYQWSQDGPDLTVHFQLPANTSKSSITCKFLVDHISLLVKDTDISYPYRKLWSTIRPDDSVWTLDSSSNILTLNITKSDEYTRWPQLFDQDDGVLETLDPNYLSEIRERMAKFTTAAPEDEDNAATTTNQSINPSSFVQPAQHPASMDMDEDIDSAGECITFCLYDNETGNALDSLDTGMYRWICDSFEATKQQQTLPSVCLQMDVDGLVFDLKDDVDNHKLELEHVATFDAFAFVRASKRDARFILHDPSLTFTCIIESSRNCYIYYHHDDKRTVEVQTLVDLTQGHDADVIGAQLVLDKTLMVLTENDIIVINV